MENRRADPSNWFWWRHSQTVGSDMEVLALALITSAAEFALIAGLGILEYFHQIIFIPVL